MACNGNENVMLVDYEGLGGVSLCSCGTLHVSVGSVTVRLAPEAFLQMVKMCQEAAGQLTIEKMMQAANGLPSKTLH